MLMARTAVEIDPQLIAFVLPSIPESVRIARFRIRAALGFHGLAEYADDAETITAELVGNAVRHAGADSTEMIAITLMRVRRPDAVAIVVADSSPHPPVMQKTTAASERGRGLQVVDALAVHWGWNPDDSGKEVFAVLAREE